MELFFKLFLDLVLSYNNISTVFIYSFHSCSFFFTLPAIQRNLDVNKQKKLPYTQQLLRSTFKMFSKVSENQNLMD